MKKVSTVFFVFCLLALFLCGDASADPQCQLTNEYIAARSRVAAESNQDFERCKDVVSRSAWWKAHAACAQKASSQHAKIRCAHDAAFTQKEHRMPNDDAHCSVFYRNGVQQKALLARYVREQGIDKCIK